MNIFKKRISLILSLVMIALVVLPIFIVSAANEISINVKLDSQALTAGKSYQVEGGEKITVSATSKDIEIAVIAYAFSTGEQGTVEEPLEVPEAEPGSSVTVSFNVGGYDANGNQVLSGWKSYLLNYIDPDDGECEVTMEVKLDGKTLTAGKTYDVEGGEKITAVAESTTTDIAFIGYGYVVDNKVTNIIDVDGGELEFTVPTGVPGTTKIVAIEAVAENNNDDDRTRTGWMQYVLRYVEQEEKDLSASYEGSTLKDGSTTVANPGELVKIVATPEDEVTVLKYKWDNDDWNKHIGGGSTSTRIPTDFEPGSTHWLYLRAEYEDGSVEEAKYKFEIPEEASEVTMNVKLDSKTITAGKSYNVEGGEKIEVSASCKGSEIDYIKYRFGSEDSEKEYSDLAEFKVPDEDADTTLKLYVEAVAEDGSTTGQKVYTLKFVDVLDGELDMEPWMEENDEITDLAINLRNDSEEEDKANKNIYALDETVTYFIDYKNGTGDDIDSEVSIELELPLEFDVVSAGAGKVDEDDRIIRWEFKDGLEEDEAGTLVVKVKYTEFTKSKYDSETIYPSAAIYKGSKEKDRSTVINLIIEEYDMEIDETHTPYMFGDEDTPTFRPDDSISRAEGALVLARIYGLNYENTKVTNTFSDLDETYEIAQKAIVAATKAGLINGYSDGTYRPNEKMTRAEFMKILACMVEENAEDEDIEGLEIKDLENTIKVYADSERYYIVDGKKIFSHWALEEVSLLARLNMTPLSEDDDELELDAEITRAEVAQLVNFYLLRAPANVTSKTKSGFDDVSKKHDLFADIIEATRDAHTFSMDEEDGTEVAE